MRSIILTGLILFSCLIHAQENYISKVWVADQSNGTYQNPILHADYSDPDAVRVGNDFYMVSSSFEDVPGLPILHSKDLVNWKLIGHALQELQPVAHYSFPRHGSGVWAPSIRYHNNEFYIYYPDPDFGIYLVKAKHPSGPWSQPVLVEEGKGLIDPCPLWDDDGKVYLVHAFAGSRAGIKSVLVVKQMNSEGTRILDNGVLVYDGHDQDPTVEGPKFYKRNGYYYIFAPAGGVSTGWQLALRSKNIYGPYERRIVMDQGATSVNGPHQGAWVNTTTGEDWFLHFQDKEAYGRVVHLQPMKWVNDWPVIGMDKDGDGKGEPVMNFRKPRVVAKTVLRSPMESDEFNGTSPGLQWQWMANTRKGSFFMQPSKGVLKLFSQMLPDSARNLWDAPHVILQKFPAGEFMVTTRFIFKPNQKLTDEEAGLVVMGLSYAGISVKSAKDGNYFVYSVCKDASKGNPETEKKLAKADSNTVYLRVIVTQGGRCAFSYSNDGNIFHDAGEEFMAVAGRWKGAKLGLFCSRQGITNDAGSADIDWFRVEPAR